jgi:hypothetical protein
MNPTHSTNAAILPQQPTVGALDSLGLAAELLAEGLREGTPRHLTAQSKAIDRRLCRRLRCPACRRRGLSYRPLTDGRRYVVLAVYTGADCGAAEEV